MNQKFSKYAPLVSSVVTLIVYIVTMSRGVMPIDAGELAASQYTLGVSHPSGYPLFNFIGFLWSRIPIGSVIFRLNLLCAIWVALANFFMVKTAFLLLQKTFTVQKKDPKSKSKGNTIAVNSGNPFLQLLASISGILVVAFCRTWWIQSAGVEVYSLHLALLSIFFFVFTRTWYKEKTSMKDWAIVGLVLGLCFTNHLTSFNILVGVVILYFWKMKFTGESIKFGFGLVGAAAVVFLLFYGFMMIRAGSSPTVNYGDPSNMEYLKRHVTGWQYQSFFNEKGKNPILQLFFEGLSNEMTIGGIFIIMAGLIFLMIKNTKMGVFWLVHFVSALIYASNYKIHDIQNYFLLCYMSAGIFISFFVYWIYEMVKLFQKQKNMAFVLLALPAIPLVLNFEKTDQSKTSYIDDYTIGALNSVADNAIILSWEWDEFVGPAYYYQHVEKIRPDVLIIDKELLRRSWYYNQIKTWDPDLASKIQSEADAFNQAVLPFERKEKYDPEKLQSSFVALITSILDQYKERPVYVSSLILDVDISRGSDVVLPDSTILIPESYFFRITDLDTTTYYPLPKPLEFNVNFTADQKDDRFQRRIMNFTMNVLSSRVVYETSFGKKEEARKVVQLMQTIDPSITMPEGLAQ